MDALYIQSYLLESCCCVLYKRHLCISVHPRKKEPSSMVLREVSYFPCLGFFVVFFLSFLSHPVWVIRIKNVTFLQCVKAQWENVQIVMLGYTNKIWDYLIWFNYYWNRCLGGAGREWGKSLPICFFSVEFKRHQLNHACIQTIKPLNHLHNNP